MPRDRAANSGTGDQGHWTGGCRYCHHVVTWGVAVLSGRQSQPMCWCTLSVSVLGEVLSLPAVWSLGGSRSFVAVDLQPIWGCASLANRPLPATGTWGVAVLCGRQSQDWKGARRSLE